MTEQKRSTKRVAVYVRVSTKGQFGGVDDSLDTQLSMIHQRLEADERFDRVKYEVVDTFREEGRSGKDTDRPELQRLLAGVRANRFDLVVVTKIDRFTRSLLDFYALWGEMEKHGVQFLSLGDKLDSAGSAGRAMMKLILVFAELERERTSERTKEKVEDRRQRGLWFGGQLPIGLKPHPKDKTTLEVDENGAKVVRYLFDKLVETGSSRGATRAARAAGMTRPARVDKNGELVKAKPLAENSVARLLQNRAYIAERVLPDGSIIAANWPALIDRDTFERAQLLLAKNRVTKPSGRDTKYQLLLDGLLRCGKCGGAMTYASATGRSKTYHYYECVTGRNRGAEACPTKAISAPALEGFVLEHLRGFSVDADTLRAAVREANAGRDTELSRLKAETENLRHMLAVNTTSARNLVAAMTKLGADVPASVLEESRALGLARKEIELQLVDLEAKRDAIATRVLETEQVADAFRHFSVLFDAAKRAGAREELRDLLRSIVDVIEWREDANDPKKGEALVLLFAPLNGLIPADGDRLKTPETTQPNDGSLGCATWLRHLGSNQGPCD